MIKNQPTGAFVSEGMLSEEQRLEIGQMLREGVSMEGIKAVVEAWTSQPISYVSFAEYGKSPIETAQEYMDKYPTWAKTVEGTVVEPITDEGRLLS